LGAGLGSAGVILLLFAVFPEQLLTVLMLSGIAASLLVSIDSFDRSKYRIITSVIIGLTIIFTPTGWATLKVSPYKSLNQLL